MMCRPIALMLSVLTIVCSISCVQGAESKQPPGVFMGEVPPSIAEAIRRGLDAAGKKYPLSGMAEVSVQAVISAIPRDPTKEAEVKRAGTLWRALRNAGPAIVPAIERILSTSQDDELRIKAASTLMLFIPHPARRSQETCDLEDSLIIPMICRTALDRCPRVRQIAISGMDFLCRARKGGIPQIIRDTVFGVYGRDPDASVRKDADQWLKRHGLIPRPPGEQYIIID